jgi:hypothetical protein
LHFSRVVQKMFSIIRLQSLLEIERSDVLEMLNISVPMIEDSIKSLLESIDVLETKEIAFKVHTINGRLQYSGCEDMLRLVEEFDTKHKSKINTNVPFTHEELSHLKMTLSQTHELSDAKIFIRQKDLTL